MSMYIVNEDSEKKEAKIRLYGQIGDKVDGDLFARELSGLDERVDTVHLHINSPGGDVLQGLSIVSVMLGLKAFLHVHVDGIAASMAAVIAVCGDKVSMMDFGKLMIHDPFFSNQDPGKLTPKQRKSLASVTDTLRTILSRRGKSKEEISKLMTDETWFTAEEAKRGGLIDEVVSSKQADKMKGLSTDEILRVVAELSTQNNNNQMDLKKIAKELGLAENATEADILAAIKKDKEEAAARQKAALDDLLARGAKVGLVTEKNKEKMIKLSDADPDLLRDLVEEAEASAATEEEKAAEAKKEEKKEEETTKADAKGFSRLSQALADLRKSTPAATVGASEKTYDWLQKNDPDKLKELEKSDPKKFEALLNVYENSL